MLHHANQPFADLYYKTNTSHQPPQFAYSTELLCSPLTVVAGYLWILSLLTAQERLEKQRPKQNPASFIRQMSYLNYSPLKPLEGLEGNSSMSMSHCNHNRTYQTNQDILPSPIVFNSANLSDQGLTSFKELIALYNTVTDGDHLSVDNGTADRLVNIGTWPRMECWKTLYHEVYVAGRKIESPNGPANWDFVPNAQTVVVGWDCHNVHVRHECTDMKCRVILADVCWENKDFGMRCPIVVNLRVRRQPDSSAPLPYVITSNFVCAAWSDEYRETLETELAGPLGEYNKQMFSWLARSLTILWKMPLKDVTGSIRQGWLLDLGTELDKYVHMMPK